MIIRPEENYCDILLWIFEFNDHVIFKKGSIYTLTFFESIILYLLSCEHTLSLFLFN